MLSVWLKGELMLKIGKYTKQELALELTGANSRQALKNRLERYDVDFEIEGRGENIIFDIKAINNPFKLYCILELGFAAQTDFDRLALFYYYYFCDENFVRMTAEEKEEYMDDNVVHVSRQTIRTWELRLERNNWIAFADNQCVYYFSRQGIHRQATKEEYSEAWRYYWKKRYEGELSWIIMDELTEMYGGVPRKHFLPCRNVFYVEQINDFIALILEAIA